MEPGNIVEFIDRQKIKCAVVLDVKKMKLRLLTEGNREVNVSAGRLAHKGDTRLDLSMGRDKLVDALKKTATRRKELISDINIEELWDVLNSEQEWIDLPTMTEFCFPDNPGRDHEAAVIRAFFHDRQYFKFNLDGFFPNSEAQVEKLKVQAEENERKNRIIDKGGAWLKSIINSENPAPSDEHLETIKILKSHYLYDKESPHYESSRQILAKAGITNTDIVLKLLVKLGVWDEDENLNLLILNIPQEFSREATEQAAELIQSHSHHDISIKEERKDFTRLPMITIDGQATLDFDDALSIQTDNGQHIVGIHIADVGHFVKKGDPVDQAAIERVSSIYMPDRKIPMIPPFLAEDLCSLKAGKNRPAISVMARVTPAAEVVDFEIIPSIVKVKHQLTYFDANQLVEEDHGIRTLFELAKKFQQNRLDRGAVQITLPEINVWIDEDGSLNVSKTNRESPGRLLVAELMIMANWLMARYLSSKGIHAIFRTQAGPKERLFRNNEGTLFQNWMQRKHLSRFILNPEPESHSGLGLEAYVTASSPIRKFFDLATQRQLRAGLRLEPPYKTNEIEHIIQTLEQPMRTVSRIQYQRHRYWLLKYLEDKIGEREEAIVLSKRRNNYYVLLTGYMMECALPVSVGIDIKPEDIVQVTIQRVDARKDVLTVFLS